MEDAKKAAEAINEKLLALETAQEKAVTKDEIEKANKALEDFKTENAEAMKGFAKASDVSATNKKVDELQSDMTSFMESVKSKNDSEGVATMKEAVRKSLSQKNEKGITKAEELKNWAKEAFKTQSGNFTVQLKAPALVTTGNLTPTGAADVYATQSATSYSPYEREEIFVEQFFDVGNTELASIPYVDELPGEGDAAIVAEGSLKPLIDVDYVTAYSQARKVAGRMKATEEALYDYGWLESAMTTTLKRKHDIAKQADFLGANGLDGIATVFNPTILGGVTVTSPQYYDAIAALVSGIANDSEGAYMPNIVFVNTLDNLKKMLVKDANNNYVMPPFADQNGNIVDGVRIVAKPSIAPGSFVIGDFKNVKVRNLWGYTVRFGWENDDFGKNQITMVGESRYHLYSTTNDRRGIIKGAFADVITALTTV